MMNTLEQELSLQAVNGVSEYPLSLGQDDVWLQCQLYPNSNVYKLAVELSVSGPLDFALFAQAFQDVVDRHDALRAVFHAADDIPVQRILPSVTASLPVIDLSGDLNAQTTGNRADVTIPRAQKLLGLPFDLTIGPLFRAELLRFGANDHHFILTFHRLIMDGFHGAQFIEELARTYLSHLRGTSLPQPLALQYGDFAVWQKRRMNTGIFEASTEYWQRLFHEPLPETLVPTDHPVPAARTFRSGSYVSTLDAPLCRSLRALEKPCRTTLFRIVLTAFAIFVARLCGEEEILLAVPFSTRPREMAGALGFFSNVVPLRLDLRGNPSFRKFLLQINTQLRHAAEHKEFALADVLQNSKTQRPQGRPVFPVAVSQVGSWELKAEGLHMTSAGAFSMGMMHDLCLAMAERGELFDLYYVYSSEIFERNKVIRWTESVRSLLEEVAARPDAPLSHLESLAEVFTPAKPKREVVLQPVPRTGNLARPSTELERRLVAIWQETLDCKEIGIDDDLFERGAHSLMMAKVHRKLSALLASASVGIQDRPPIKLSLRAIFDNPTIRNLATLLAPWFPEQDLSQEDQEAKAEAVLTV
ncbi:MAG TPA: condensation domain-containing protein [Candidatus Angelobacter sp.]|jgi:hypothetical protein